MRAFRHNKHIAYQIVKNKIVLIRYINDGLIKFYLKGHGLRNIKFNISDMGRFILIRLPFFLFVRNSGEIKIGFPNLYLWFIK